VRVGNTVRRTPSERAGFVHQLLELFARRGWTGPPWLLGIDGRGREILSFLVGHVAWAPVQPPAVWSDASLVGVAELVRQFHDLTAGSPLAGDQEVVCHNDLSPRNTVYRDLGDGLRPVALLDWDLAAPGRRLDDLAHTCWQYLDLGSSVRDLAAAAHRLRLLCDAYGLGDRAGLVERILWQDRCWRGIEAAAAAGRPSGVALREAGAVASVRAAWRWVAEHRVEPRKRWSRRARAPIICGLRHRPRRSTSAATASRSLSSRSRSLRTRSRRCGGWWALKGWFAWLAPPASRARSPCRGCRRWLPSSLP